MQSTGVYWIAVQEVLEAAGLEVYLVNARGTTNLPGRKSDVQECQWLMKLHTYGLLANSFRPPEEIRMIRTIWRQRSRLVKRAILKGERDPRELAKLRDRRLQASVKRR
jgi:transposase